MKGFRLFSGLGLVIALAVVFVAGGCNETDDEIRSKIEMSIPSDAPMSAYPGERVNFEIGTDQGLFIGKFRIYLDDQLLNEVTMPDSIAMTSFDYTPNETQAGDTLDFRLEVTLRFDSARMVSAHYPLYVKSVPESLLLPGDIPDQSSPCKSVVFEVIAPDMFPLDSLKTYLDDHVVDVSIPDSEGRVFFHFTPYSTHVGKTLQFEIEGINNGVQKHLTADYELEVVPMPSEFAGDTVWSVSSKLDGIAQSLIRVRNGRLHGDRGSPEPYPYSVNDFHMVLYTSGRVRMASPRETSSQPRSVRYYLNSGNTRNTGFSRLNISASEFTSIETAEDLKCILTQHSPSFSSAGVTSSSSLRYTGHDLILAYKSQSGQVGVIRVSDYRNKAYSAEAFVEIKVLANK
ncbi:hypothetical protein FUAX_40110 (plasmid) [Fulvitalea axinellae]|uniref:DUF1735 domain-containing protein n=1 Tax=Fulvitalea axinellae TaxID=1182444 RepID=A0AAU9CHC3_9BACT|nr:hypothetical protein FUAX_40110 [Fulvitalea axinellae]